MMSSSKGPRPSAFTLVELLVVIAIIGVLAGLGMAAFPTALEMSRSTKCLSNLRQIAMASMSYSSENDGVLVPMASGTTGADAVTFRALLLPYINNDMNMTVFRCPSDTMEMQRTLNAAAWIQGLQPTSYGINASYNAGNPSKYHAYVGRPNSSRLASIPNPSTTIFLADTGKPDSISGAPSTWTDKQKTKTAASYGFAKMPNVWLSNDFDIYPRHGKGRCNVAFYDGHCATVDIAKDIIAHPPGDAACLYDYH